MLDERLGLTLGPLFYLWDDVRWRDFYFRIADEADVENVVLGEVVCSKRNHFHSQALDEVIARLTAAGKRVRLGTPALVTLDREVKTTRHLATQADFELEVGEIAAHRTLRGRPHAIGPLVNVYNAASARVLGSGGATTICLPPELPLTSIDIIAHQAPELDFEVFGFGRVPLAISARCAHARMKGLTKDNCLFVCGEDPDGLPVHTLDGQAFLALNGVQTLSATCMSAIGDLTALAKAGVRTIRLSPQVCDMVAVAEVYRAVADRILAPEEGLRRLGDTYPSVGFSNGFLHGRPGHELVRQPLT